MSHHADNESRMKRLLLASSALTLQILRHAGCSPNIDLMLDRHVTFMPEDTKPGGPRGTSYVFVLPSLSRDCQLEA